jgi:hypothetical protein
MGSIQLRSKKVAVDSVQQGRSLAIWDALNCIKLRRMERPLGAAESKTLLPLGRDEQNASSLCEVQAIAEPNGWWLKGAVTALSKVTRASAGRPI